MALRDRTVIACPFSVPNGQRGGALDGGESGTTTPDLIDHRRNGGPLRSSSLGNGFWNWSRFAELN